MEEARREREKDLRERDKAGREAVREWYMDAIFLEPWF
jgi:hypothetical protein